jgi:hypothetical protein
VAYREEAHHAALPRPEVATGVLRVTDGGRLLKDQRVPRREISEIGAEFISVRETPEGPANLLPIPDALRPMLDAIRLVVAGDAEGISEQFGLELLAGGPGWRVGLVPRAAEAPEMRIVLIGCGAVLRAIEIEQARGVRRVMILERQQ